MRRRRAAALAAALLLLLLTTARPALAGAPITTAIYTADPAALVDGDTPLGPFRDAKGGPLISDSTPGSSPLDIDPTVFTDDDGQVYLYRGSSYGLRAVRLTANMTSTIGSVITPSGVTNFWEAPWMFKRNGVYHLAYAANDSGCSTPGHACVRYATASGSYVSPWETPAAVNDGHTPASSADHSHGAYGNWNHQGTEWVEYRWPAAQTVSRSGTAADTFNAVTFPQLTTTRLRLSVTSRTGYSTGVLEWRAFS
ncbi:family 43 glycosylhydrolase [Actinomadura sp. ATCC 31491]|uniref:Family 43 glycosylhydrolase n=1 Tax=Actinomadura luzonensis TaxID=2805427 RepID=A0ABT0G637_9ACTN|nr:family 43 glycosylhydrolase [Actinomadura luzonensis]MCK2220059.1 family 43 glycosylhydrolase [Actinomadura luzonensis]